VPDPSGQGVLEREVDTERRKQPCLDDERVRELARLARRIEKHYGCAQDMEWALAGAGDEQQFYLLQSRPETVWAKREAQPAMAPKASAFEHVFAVLGSRHKP
jgi:pyruvate,water dikinase